MSYQRRTNPVQRSLSRPLTILGAERKLFFFAMSLGAATFNLLGSLLGGVLMFLLLYFVARWASHHANAGDAWGEASQALLQSCAKYKVKSARIITSIIS
jgi:type IV secretory pathway TrbD component